MKSLARMLALAGCLVAAAAVGHLVPIGAHAQGAKPHRIAIQVDQNDPAVMNLALNNAQNAIDYYRDKGEKVDIEIVAFGPGLNMLRADTSPVKARIATMANTDDTFPSKIVFSACHNTLEKMEKAAGHAIKIVPQARMVPAGIVRLAELEAQGWSYIRP
jgi:intracellular sulfur oxidation DsrE/DsrF family protein